MRPSELLNLQREAIRQIVLSNRALNPRVFGSTLHGVDTVCSDLDLLVDPTHETTLMDIAKVAHQLQRLLGIKVDVLTPRALPEKLRATVIA